MTTVTSNFTGAGLSAVLSSGAVAQTFDWSLSGTWTTPAAGISLQREVIPGGGAWETVAGPYTANASGVYVGRPYDRLRFISAITAGTVTYSVADRVEVLQSIKDAAGNLIATYDESGVTFPGAITFSELATAVETAEHGAGAIGTAVVPKTYRCIQNGVIVTQIKFDLTGLASVATANDVIGLAAGGAAYIGRNVVATNGVVFKTEFSCLETPAGGDNDVNIVTSSDAALAYDGAGGTTYISNSGDLLAGQTVQNLVPALTANDYFYLTAGTGDTAGTYTAGMYVLTLYGHPALS